MTFASYVMKTAIDVITVCDRSIEIQLSRKGKSEANTKVKGRRLKSKCSIFRKIWYGYKLDVGSLILYPK